MRKVAFPHMGNLSIALKTFFLEMDLEVVVPPKNSKRTLDLGARYSPEFACLPLKLNIGNFIEAIEKGANTIVMGGGVGPCRFGYYGEVQREILEDLGYSFEILALEPDIKDSFLKLKKLFGGIPVKKIYQAGKLAWLKMKAIDKIHKLVLKYRAREQKENQIDKIYGKYLKLIDKAMTVERINKLTEQYRQLIKNTAGEFKKGIEIRIGIVGEIYLVLEPFVNLDLAKRLGKLGASVERGIYLTHWVNDFLHLGKERELIEEAAAPYLRSSVGGHGLDSIGNSVRYSRRGFDGIIQVAPFTCMPEIIAQTVLPEVSKSEEIPVLSLIFDEHTGEAGLQTRLEAFVDLIFRQKDREGVKLYG